MTGTAKDNRVIIPVKSYFVTFNRDDVFRIFQRNCDMQFEIRIYESTRLLEAMQPPKITNKFMTKRGAGWHVTGSAFFDESLEN